MTTFKHGDRVTCEIAGIKITDARISISNPLLISGSKVPFICQNFKNGVPATEKLGYEYSWKLDNNFYEQDVTNLRLVEKTLDDIEVGDMLFSESFRGSCKKVIFRSGELVILKNGTTESWSPKTIWTITELRNLLRVICHRRNLNQEYKVEQPEPEVPAPIKMTVAQIAEKLGHEVEIIK